MNLIIKEYCSGYANRTKYNVWTADLTIAFAMDFSTSGEKLTKKAACERYLAIPLNSTIPAAKEMLAYALYGVLVSIVNIAGNGIYTFCKYAISQHDVNKYVFEVLKDFKDDIKTIISGGQTGADIAGIVAACKLGIPAEVNMPKGFVQRDMYGVDHSNTEATIRKQILDMVDEL